MKLLAVDRGNTRTKTGVYHHNEWIEVKTFASEEVDEMLHYLLQIPFQASIISSVAAGNMTPVIELMEAKGPLVKLGYGTPLPLMNRYATPNTLGSDRIAGAVGAWVLSGKNNVLLIDAGTCINYECVVDAAYLGGAISPGIDMRLQAMHHFTGKLPRLNLDDTDGLVELTGNSTAGCMFSGAVLGAAMEVEGMITRYKALYPDIQVILTGGSVSHLGRYIKNSIFAPHNHVVLTGLVEILKFNLNAY